MKWTPDSCAVTTTTSDMASNASAPHANVSVDCDDINQFQTLSSSHFQTFIYLSYILIMIVSLIGNGLVCYLVVSSSRMRSVTNLFIVNLSVGDMLMTLLCVPFSFVNVLILMYWPFGEIMCRLVSYWQGVSVFVSAYTLVAISMDRYIAIMSPLRPRMSKSWAKAFMGGIWLFACATALPILIVSKTFLPDDPVYKTCRRYVCQEDWDTEEDKFYYTIVLMILQYAVPFFVLVYTYTRIAIVVWGKKTPGEAENVRDTRMAQRKRKMIKMMVTVVVVFTICWLPFNVMQFFLDYEEVRNWPGLPYLWFSFHWLAMSHACYNPVIYAFMNNRFKIGFIGILSKFRCARRLLSKYNEKALSGLAGMECTENTLQRRHTTTTYISVDNIRITAHHHDMSRFDLNVPPAPHTKNRNPSNHTRRHLQ